MIPEKKKTLEEIAALPGDLGIPEAATEEVQKLAPQTVSPVAGPVIHLDLPAISAAPRNPQNHSLRRNDLPLAPAPLVTTKTVLPTHRHAPGDISQMRKREALAQIDSDPAARLRAQTASPYLFVPGYLLALAAAVLSYQLVNIVAPIALLSLAILITLFIAVRKPRSRHHAALIFIVVFLTAALGGINYATLFNYGP